MLQQDLIEEINSFKSQLGIYPPMKADRFIKLLNSNLSSENNQNIDFNSLIQETLKIFRYVSDKDLPGFWEIIKVIIENGADISGSIGNELLFLAIKQDNQEMVESLIKKYSVQINDQQGFIQQTPLHFAIKEGKEEIAKLLLQIDGISNIKDLYGVTFLHLAAFHGFQEIVELLVQKDIGLIDALNRNSQTPLDVATGEGHIEVVEFLLKNGANPSLVDIEGIKKFIEDYNIENTVPILNSIKLIESAIARSQNNNQTEGLVSNLEISSDEANQENTSSNTEESQDASEGEENNETNSKSTENNNASDAIEGSSYSDNNYATSNTSIIYTSSEPKLVSLELEKLGINVESAQTGKELYEESIREIKQQEEENFAVIRYTIKENATRDDFSVSDLSSTTFYPDFTSVPQEVSKLPSVIISDPLISGGIDQDIFVPQFIGQLQVM